MRRLAPEGGIAVAIVEAQPAILEGLALLVGRTPGFRCSACARSVEVAMGEIDADPPDVVLIDLGLPGASAVEGIRRIRGRHPETPVMVLSVHDDDPGIVEALHAGACGCLPKKTPPRELLEAVRAVAIGGGGPLSSDTARRVLGLVERRASPRVARLLSLIADGHNLETAAAELGVAVPVAGARLRAACEQLYARETPGK